MAIAMVNGDKDKNANSFIDADKKVLERRRCEVEVIQFPGGHVVGPPEVIEKAMTWVQENTEVEED